jgi:hypothetical protein
MDKTQLAAVFGAFEFDFWGPDAIRQTAKNILGVSVHHLVRAWCGSVRGSSFGAGSGYERAEYIIVQYAVVPGGRGQPFSALRLLLIVLEILLRRKPLRVGRAVAFIQEVPGPGDIIVIAHDAFLGLGVCGIFGRRSVVPALMGPLLRVAKAVAAPGPFVPG